MITVLVAGSPGQSASALAARLDRHPGFRALVAHPDAGLAAQIDATRPDVLLLEWTGESPEATLDAVTLLPRPPAVVLMADRAPDALEAGRHGAVAAVLPRHSTPAELVAAVEAAAVGLLVVHRDVVGDLRWLPGAGYRRVAGPGGDQPLTARELEVLGMLAEGLANKSIAARLGISDHTVKFHVGAILDKLRVDSRTEAVTVGIRRGLIPV